MQLNQQSNQDVLMCYKLQVLQVGVLKWNLMCKILHGKRCRGRKDNERLREQERNRDEHAAVKKTSY